MSELRFDNRVVIITGAGNGLGRSHALLFGARGAKVVVNDLGGSMHGGGKSSAAADKVVEEIKAAGGQAVANYDSVEDGDKIVESAVKAFGKVDIIVNNAGILRDTSFQKMSQEDWDLIYKVHVLGSMKVTKAAWNLMRDQGYGRIVFTASAAGIYGNFGQANYSMAKLGLVGLSNTLAIEGKKKNVLVNTIAPIAGSRLTETVLPKELIDALKPEYVSPLVAWLAHESCDETGGLFEVGGGFFGKLRWERTEGKLIRLGRGISPEQVQKAWKDITSFDKTTHPADVTSSMSPILENINKKSRGGNDLIDCDAAIGYEFPPVKSSYDERDLALYALGVGAAKDPTKDLQLVYEMNGEGFHALPTFGVVPALKAVFDMAKEGKQAPGLNYGFDRVLHGEQYTEVKAPLPRKANLTHKIRVKDIFDKGKNALVITEMRTYDESGRELVYNELTTFVRGAGGWGGDRGPSADVNVPPERAPDKVIEEKTDPNQALLYRLSGDWNPLHADPNFAKAFGFEKPILHGLCTFGFAGRHVIKAFCNDDPRYFKSIKVRFAESVFPGETIVTEMWKDGDKVIFRSKVKERDKVVISNAAVELYKEIPKLAEPAKAAQAPTPATSGSVQGGGEPTTKDIFWGIKHYVSKHPELAKSVGNVFQFKIKNPDSAYVLDLKNGDGSLKDGTVDKADVTLELEDSDFIGMASGKLNPQKLFMSGKLKISGNVMASQKLDFLQKIDPKETLEAMKAAGYVPGGGAAPAASPAAETYTSADVFTVIKDHVEKNPDLVSVGNGYLFKLKNPDSAWTVDLKNGKGSVSAGAPDKADCTLELEDSDFMAMTSGAADPQKLFMGGKLKISGNIMASQKLTFLKKLDPAAAKEAVAKARASAPAQAAAAPAQKKEAQAPAIFKALGERLAKNPALSKEIGAVVVFKVDGSAWTVSDKVTEGADAKAAATITVSEEDLALLAKGESAKGLYQHGKLRVDGDVRVAHRLGFMKGVG
jgi:3-hydroxyacyl-CoA dehydrogenase/3a,7a,12a-trihydroxy-5b-cholest-24-enoyl-CoA hydratase